MKLDIIWFMLVTLRLSSSLEKLQMTPIITLIVCEGDNLHMREHFEEDSDPIQRFILYRNGGDRQDPLLIKDAEGVIQLFDDRITHKGITDITIRNVSAEDSGAFEMNFVFERSEATWQRYQATVLADCPDKRQYYCPNISIKVGSGHWEPAGDIIHIERDTAIILNVSIPRGNPAVNCTITEQISGHTYVHKGSSESPSAYHWPFYYRTPGVYTVTVQLTHDVMHPSSVRMIQIIVTEPRTSVLPTTTTSGITPDDDTEKSIEEIQHFCSPIVWSVMSVAVCCCLALGTAVVILVRKIAKLEHINKLPLQGNNNEQMGDDGQHEGIKTSRQLNQKQQIRQAKKGDIKNTIGRGDNILKNQTKGVRWEYDDGEEKKPFPDSDTIEAVYEAGESQIPIKFRGQDGTIDFTEMVVSTVDVTYKISRQQFGQSPYSRPLIYRPARFMVGEGIQEIKEDNERGRFISTESTV